MDRLPFVQQPISRMPACDLQYAGISNRQGIMPPKFNNLPKGNPGSAASKYFRDHALASRRMFPQSHAEGRVFQG